MKALQPLNFLIRHLRPSSLRSSLLPPFSFYFARATRLSVTPSNRIFHPRQAQFNSTATSSNEAFQNNASTQNAESASASEVSSPFYAVKPKDESSFSSPEGSHDTSFRPERKDHSKHYNLTFTCKPCNHRSTHDISKQGYHNGTVLITCPNCKNRHVISDHLKIFSDLSLTIEDILRQKGETLKRGRINEKGDVEFFPDPREVPHVLNEQAKIARLMKDMQPTESE